jgi:hypothetical protein
MEEEGTVLPQTKAVPLLIQIFALRYPFAVIVFS